MYGLLACSKCKRLRILDLHQKSSACPYCNKSERTESAKIVFTCADQEDARRALSQATGFEAPDDSRKKDQIAKADPHSTLIYRYENSNDLDEKMLIIAKGLTEIHGTFTIDDVAGIVGEKNAEKYVSAMMDRCYISEVKIGFYKG